MAGGVVASLLLAQAPLLVVVTREVRMVQLGAAVLGMVGMLERVLANARSGHGDQAPVRARPESMHPNGNHTGGSEQ
jgi:hypothetical protein